MGKFFDLFRGMPVLALHVFRWFSHYACIHLLTEGLQQGTRPWIQVRRACTGATALLAMPGVDNSKTQEKTQQHQHGNKKNTWGDLV